jgi:hypothetical protein
MRELLVAVIVVTMTGCAIERAQVAQDARTKMLGLSKEQVLACMGAPATRMAEGATEVWAYNSGDGHTAVFGSGSSQTTASIIGGMGQATTNSFGSAVATKRYCTVNVVMTDGRVSRVNYAGPTGGLITSGEQCAFAVRNCVGPG